MSKMAQDPKATADHVEDVERKSIYNEDTYIAEKDVGQVVDDEAAGYTNAQLYIDEAESKRLKRMINRRVLPIMMMVYMTQAIDKSALGPVSIMGWLEDVGSKGQDFAMTSTVMWIGIIAGEPIANQLIRRYPVAKILAIAMVFWTGLSIWLAFSLTIPPVLGNRFLLGFFESVFGPCLLSITVQWYKREEQPMISATWQSMSALATAFTSLLGYGFAQVSYKPPGLRGWQYLILVISICSAISTVVTWFTLPDSPTKVKWADEELKTKFVERVRANDQGIKHKEFKKEQAWEALKDPYTYLLFFLALFNTLVVGGIGKFNSLLINRAFGFDVLTSQLLKIPMSLIGVSFYFLGAWLITKYNNTLYTMIGLTTLNLTGTIVLIAVAPSESTKVGLFIAFLCMQAFGACNPCIFLMLSRNSAGQTKKSFTYAITYMGWAGGNAIAPQLFWDSWAPRYVNSLYIHVGLYGGFIAVILTMRALLVYRNKKKIAGQTMADGTVVNNNSHAFEDLTDLQNPDFRYSL